MSQLAIATAALFTGAALVIYMLALVALYVLYVVGYWRIFTKAGEAGWKSIVPFLNVYTEFKVTWMSSIFWLWLALEVLGAIFGSNQSNPGLIGSLISIASLVLHVIACNKMSKAFGKGLGYTIGLIFLEPFFIMALGFGDAAYQGPQE
jgi:hypothetical protein